MFPSFPYGKQSVFIFEIKLCLYYAAGNFNENSSIQALAKILRARASEHSSNFCEQFEQRPNFASTFKLDGTIRYPSLTAFNTKRRYKQLAIVVRVLQNAQNLVIISRCCFAEDGKEMDKNSKRTCIAIAFLIKPFVW